MTAALTKPYSVFTNISMTSLVSSVAIDVSRLIYGSVSVWWTGTPTGTVIAEAQNGDAPWIAITGLTATTGGASGNALFTFTILPFEKIRLTYTPSSGTGTLNGILVAKGY
jgi:hypothetical protein